MTGRSAARGERELRKYLDFFNEKQTLERKRYPAGLFNKSYVLVVIQLWVAQQQEEADKEVTVPEVAELIQTEEEEYSVPEGRLKMVTHLQRERRPGLARLAKWLFRANNDGRLFCEVCGFDFGEVYGEADFIEAHHRVALRDLEAGTRTKVSDLAMVCANCHRMLHRGNPWPDVDELRERVAGRRE